jgi:NAD(P)H-flavin reductase
MEIPFSAWWKRHNYVSDVHCEYSPLEQRFCLQCWDVGMMQFIVNSCKNLNLANDRSTKTMQFLIMSSLYGHYLDKTHHFTSEKTSSLVPPCDFCCTQKLGKFLRSRRVGAVEMIMMQVVAVCDKENLRFRGTFCHW